MPLLVCNPILEQKQENKKNILPYLDNFISLFKHSTVSYFFHENSPLSAYFLTKRNYT